MEARSNSRGACKKKLTQKNPTLLQKLKELAAEVDYDEDIVPGLTSQEESYNIDESRDHITTNSTVITVLICQTGYTSPMIVHSLEISPQKEWVR